MCGKSGGPDEIDMTFSARVFPEHQAGINDKTAWVCHECIRVYLIAGNALIDVFKRSGPLVRQFRRGVLWLVFGIRAVVP